MDGTGELRHFSATHIKARYNSNPSAAQFIQAVGRNRVGPRTKIIAKVDRTGRVVQIALAAGQRADFKAAEAIQAPRGKGIVANSGFDTDIARRRLAAEGVAISIPPTSIRCCAVPLY